MQSLLDPSILFFIVGLTAGVLRSNLEIPLPISRFLSLYLMMALGLKGGFALAKSGITPEIASSLSCALLLAVATPLLGYMVLKRRLSGYDAAAVAATYGSVSAVTFITAVQYLEVHAFSYGGHMAAAMALMESPAIVMAVVLANLQRKKEGVSSPPASSRAPMPAMRTIIKDSLTDGTPLLLLGAMVVGILTGDSGQKAMQPFIGDLFKGMLALFLLDMGLLAARNFGGLKGKPWLLPIYAVLGPVCHAGIAMSLGWVIGMSQGNTILLMILAGSASYIAVPAVIRHAIPEANPALYFGMSLGITFPLNILVGIPVYAALVGKLWT